MDKLSTFKVPSELRDKIRDLVEGAEWYREVAGVHEAIADNVEIRNLSVEDSDVERLVSTIVLEVLDVYGKQDRVGLQLSRMADSLEKLSSCVHPLDENCNVFDTRN